MHLLILSSLELNKTRHQLKILVTGGAGFIGQNLIGRLIDRHEIVVIDDFSSGSIENISKYRSGIRIISQDICGDIDLSVDGIYNLACPASPKQYQSNPVQTMRSSVIGASNLLNLAKSSNARILQSSTSEIYGDPEVTPQNESYWGRVNPVGVRSCYDEGKRAAETMFMDYHHQYRVDTRIARIFNTYGPGLHENDGRVVSNFITQALRDDDLTIYGDGSQTRSFCYVDDLVDGLVKLFEYEGKDSHLPVNLGNPENVNMLELASLIIRLTESKSKIEFLPLPSDDPRQRTPNISRAKEVLDWEPRIDLISGINETIDYFRYLKR